MEIDLHEYDPMDDLMDIDLVQIDLREYDLTEINLHEFDLCENNPTEIDHSMNMIYVNSISMEIMLMEIDISKKTQKLIPMEILVCQTGYVWH